MSQTTTDQQTTTEQPTTTAPAPGPARKKSRKRAPAETAYNALAKQAKLCDEASQSEQGDFARGLKVLVTKIATFHQARETNELVKQITELGHENRPASNLFASVPGAEPGPEAGSNAASPNGMF